MPSNFTDLFQLSPPSFYPERQPINKLEENIALMRTAPTKCCSATAAAVRGGRGRGWEAGWGCRALLADAVRRRLLLQRCRPASRRLQALAEKMYIENYIEITMSLCCECGGTLWKKNLWVTQNGVISKFQMAPFCDFKGWFHNFPNIYSTAQEPFFGWNKVASLYIFNIYRQ